MIKGWRSLWHLLGLMFPILYFFASKKTVLVVTMPIFMFFLVFEILRFRCEGVNDWLIKNFHMVIKKDEGKKVMGALYMVMSTVLVLFIFEKGIAIASLFFLGIGDVAASLVGWKFGRIKFFGKSLEGSIACFAACFLAGYVLISVGLDITLLMVVYGALAATIAELFPIKINDNLTMPVAAAVAMHLARVFL